jgi:hypothetical protein
MEWLLRPKREWNVGAVERGREREVHWNELFPIKATVLVGELIAVFILNERSLFSGVGYYDRMWWSVH